MDQSFTGKHVGGSLYIHRDSIANLAASHRARFDEAIVRLPPSAASWNVVRISLNNKEFSFLSYPTFDSDPFPALASSWLVKGDLAWSVTHRDYSKSINPPILHRKELLIHQDDPRWTRFGQTTAAAEAIGLFDDNARIGFRREWLARIERSGYELIGDHFVPVANDLRNEQERTAGETLDVARHRTALSRSSLSAPMQALLRFGLLRNEWSIFDYGCGRGDDIRALREQGFRTAGWDPHYAADEQKVESDVVNIGFVLNVIEDDSERREALRRAFSLARRVLSVAVMTDRVSSIAGSPFRDGYLTSRNTFQKYFSREAFRDFIESVLARPPVFVAPGIAFVFPSTEDHEAFLVARQRSSRVWRRAALTRPRRVSTPKRGTTRDRLLDEVNLSMLQQFANLMLRLGRPPLVQESYEYAELIKIGGSIAKVARACSEVINATELEAARQERIDDTTVYFALRLLETKTDSQPITASLREDVRAFFGALAGAAAAGRELLHQIASPDAIRMACEFAASQGLGDSDDGHSLQLHSSLVDALPPVLRVYVAAGAALYGDVRNADIVKIHIASGKLTVLEYEDFDTSPTPSLNRRVKINLRTQNIDVFHYGGEFEKTILLEKSRFLNEEHRDFAEQYAFDESVRALGYTFPKYGLAATEFQRLLRANRLQIDGFSLVAATDVPECDEMCGTSFRYRDFFDCGDTVFAERIANIPKSPETYNALNRLARTLLDPIIEYFGGIELTFGFCSPELARAIKRRGVGRIAPALDQHAANESTAKGSLICSRRGAAVDFIVRDEDMYGVAQWIADYLPFDRMYIYGPALPIHISCGPDESRQITFVDRRAGVRPQRIKRPADAPRASIEQTD